MSDHIHPEFATHLDVLEPLLRRLKDMLPAKPVALPIKMPKAGVYVFPEGDRHLYVGRSNDIRGRIHNHSRPGATWRKAAFAFRRSRDYGADSRNL